MNIINLISLILLLKHYQV